MVSDGEVFHGISNRSNLGGGVGTRDAALDYLHRIPPVQHGNIAEVEGDCVNLDEDIVRA
jgi:hypothetical protein